MADTYFVGKTELLNWINRTLDLNLSKVEQTSSGAVACQLLDAMSPGSVALQKVDFNAVNEYDCISNYKVLQAAFNKLSIDKPIDVHKLIKARPLDNMEFMQWFKKYFEDHTGGEVLDYDAAGRRAQSKTGDVKGRGLSKRPSNLASQAGSSTPSSVRGNAPPRRTTSGQPAMHRLPSRTSSHPSEGDYELAEQMAGMKLKVDEMERERDFYFHKLRDIEILCTISGMQHHPVVSYFEKLLFAPGEDEQRDVMRDAERHFGGSGANGATA